MSGHLSEVELLDLLRPGAEPDGTSAAHLATCAACRDRLAAERALGGRLAELPSSVEPPRDLWPEVARRIAPDRGREGAYRSSGRRSRAVQLAAAAALFVLGLLLGTALDSGPEEPLAGTSPGGGGVLAAAAEVQRAGTAYVDAVARFRVVAGDAPAPLVEQGREVALAAVHGAAHELRRLRPTDDTARDLEAMASRRQVAR